MYSFNKTPKSIQVGQYSQADTKWSTPVPIFGEENGIGEYCKVVVDKKGGVHIAAYDGLEGDLWYAYLPEFDNTGNVKKCIVDSYGIIGTELNIDVALDENKNPIPYISYYAGTCAKPKVAYWANLDSLDSASVLDSTVNEVFTGAWEVTVVPTSSRVSVDHVNVGVWKSTVTGHEGELTYSTLDGDVPNGIKPGNAGANVGKSSTATDNGMVYGNGTKNPILGYAITKGSGGFIETAQMK